MNYHLLHTEELIRRARSTPLGNLGPSDWQALAGALATRLKDSLTPEAVEGELVARLQKEIADIDEAIADNPDARDEYGHMRVLLADSLAALAKEPTKPDDFGSQEAWDDAHQHGGGNIKPEPAPDSPVDVGELLRELEEFADEHWLINCQREDHPCIRAKLLIESLTKQLEGLTERLHLHGGLTPKELEQWLARLNAKGDRG